MAVFLGGLAEKVLAAPGELAEAALELEFVELSDAVPDRAGTAGDQVIRLPVDGRGDGVQPILEVGEQAGRATCREARLQGADEEGGGETEADGEEDGARRIFAGKTVELRRARGDRTGWCVHGSDVGLLGVRFLGAAQVHPRNRPARGVCACHSE